MRQQKDNMNNRIDLNQSGEKLAVVSVGTHTRLGDVLEAALAGVAFESIHADELLTARWESRKLLFAISAEESGENALLRALASRLIRCDCALEGCVCAAIVDGASGGQAHLDTIRLLLGANAAGAEVIAAPLLESGRELRQFAGGRETPFARYCALARALISHLMEAQPLVNRVDDAATCFVTALEAGTARDWRALIARYLELSDEFPTPQNAVNQTILLCENQNGLPEEETLSRLTGGGYLRLLLASPTTGGELYLACLLERAVLRGNYALPPRAVLVFEGLSATEALSSKAEVERVKGFFSR